MNTTITEIEKLKIRVKRLEILIEIERQKKEYEALCLFPSDFVETDKIMKQISDLIARLPVIDE